MDAMVAEWGALALAGAFAVVAVVLLVLWRRARSAARRNDLDRAAYERERLELELALAEQTSRLRIVRELHELVVGSVSVVISHADGARYAATEDPAAAARSAGVIADTARTTLADLRRVMALAREGELSAGPQPGLASVRDLFAAVRDDGLAIEFRETGERLALKEGAELAVFRILQEALANARRHGGEGTTALVTFIWTADGLEVVVSDDGERVRAARVGDDPGAPPAPADDVFPTAPVGRGLTEMRERAELYGGILTASTVPGVGFRVAAVFPALRDHNGIAGVRLGEE